MKRLEAYIRNIPDFPEPGIQFKDITPLVKDPAMLKLAVHQLIHPFLGQDITAVAGMEARRRPDVPLVCLATAHPAKFPDAVEKATGKRPPLPAHMANLFEMDEKFDSIGPSLQTVQQYVRENSRISGKNA